MSGGWDFAVRAGRYKLVKPGWKDESELYDLTTDAGESDDLSGKLPAVVGQLRVRYDAWDAKNVAPLWDDSHRVNVAKERTNEARPNER